MARTRASSSSPTTRAVVLLFMTLVGQSYGQLKVGFYDGKCGTNNVEKVIFDIVKAAFDKDRSIVAALLLLQFHDCFIRGCDASILLDGSNTEKTAGPKGLVRGYDLIDTIKTSLEQKCPRLASCADIIVTATRVAIFLGGGGWYDIESGRRDGMISQAKDAIANLSAGSTIQVPKAVRNFATNFLTANQINAVMDSASAQIYSGMTIQVPNAIMNFAMSSLSGTQLMTLLSVYNGVIGDLGSQDRIQNILQNNLGPLSNQLQSAYNGARKNLTPQRANSLSRIAQQFLTYKRTQTIATRLSTNYNFQFSSAMRILGTFEVLTGSLGQIRVDCHRVN